MSEAMDEIEKLRELFKSAKDDYEALKKRAKSAGHKQALGVG